MNLLLPAAIFSRSKSLIPGSVASIKVSVLTISASCAIAGSKPKSRTGAAKDRNPHRDAESREARSHLSFVRRFP